MHRLDLPLQVKLERVLPIIVRLSGGGDSIVRRIHGDEMRRYRAGLPPSPQKNLQRTQSLYGCGGGVSAAKSGKVAAMTSLQRALGAISMSALDHKRTPSRQIPASAVTPIVLQKSKVAGLRIFRENT